MKILHVAESVWGGCGTYLNELIPLQSEAFGSSSLRCVVPRQHVAHLDRVDPETIITFNRPSRGAGLPGLARAVYSATRLHKPDVIHAHSTFAGAIVRALSLVQSMPPIVYCPHGWVFDAARPGLARQLVQRVEKLLSYRSARIVAISEAERRDGQAAGISASKIVVIPNGVRDCVTEETAEWMDSRLKLLFIGRLDRQKGLDLLLEAVQHLGEAVTLRVVGERVLTGDTTGTPKREMPHVEFLGWKTQAQVSAQLNAADVVVMPSRWEGFGLVAIEAMRAGKPVIASAVGGLADIVVDGVTGVLVPAGDVDALAKAIQANDSAALQTMGRAGRLRFLANYTSDRMSNTLTSLYLQLLGLDASLKAAPVERSR